MIIVGYDQTIKRVETSREEGIAGTVSDGEIEVRMGLS